MKSLTAVGHGIFGALKINMNLLMVRSFLGAKTGEHLWEQSSLNTARSVFREVMLSAVRQQVPIHGSVVRQSVSFEEKDTVSGEMILKASLTFKDGHVEEWSSKVIMFPVEHNTVK